MQERPVQEVVRLKVFHVVAEHDRPGATGELVGVAHHTAERPAGPVRRPRPVSTPPRRGVGGEGQHVAGQLHPCARARLTGVDHQLSPMLERRFDAGVDFALGAHHGGELTLRAAPPAAADRRVDDMNALRFRARAASPSAVVSLIVEWIAMMVPGLACAASSPTTSRTCSSLSTVTLMMSAAATSARLSANSRQFGQRRHGLRPDVVNR